jgi:TolB protein
VTTPQIIIVTATPTNTIQAVATDPRNDPATSQPTPENGRIVFDSERDGNVEIYIMEADSTGQTRLTDNDFQDDEADLSSDGTQIAYSSKEGAGDWNIIIMNSDGTDSRVLTAGRHPDWSPDDQFIAYESNGTTTQLLIINVATEAIQRIPNNGQSQRTPTWSPDGERLVYMGQADGVWQLFVLEIESGEVTQITEGALSKRFPVWSPDGSLIAYNTLTNAGNPDHIWVIEPDGSNPTQLTDSGENGRPAWSPDSQFLLFNSDRNGEWQIYKMTRDGENVAALSTFGGDQRPDWGVKVGE